MSWNKAQCLPSYELLTARIPCFFANAVALSWLRAATTTSGCDLAGVISAMGLTIECQIQKSHLSPGKATYAMPAAPKTPDLMASPDFSTLGALLKAV